MTTTFTPPPRRQSPPRPRRELPVLFHLLDVSQPPGFTPARPVELPSTPSDPPSSADLFDSSAEPTNSVSQAFDLATAAGLAETSGLGSLLTEPLTHRGSHATVEEQIESNREPAQAADEPLTSTKGSTADAPLEGSAARADESVTLRQRAHERRQKRQKSAAKDDWFSTQGKFIMIGFLVALVATIYVARTGRKPAAPPLVRKPAHLRSDAAAKLATESSAPTTPKKGDAKLPQSSGPATSITSVRSSEKSPAGQSRTALHPPTIPQLSQEPAAGSPANDALFPWAKGDDTRTAARDEDLRSADLRSAAGQPSSAASTNLPPQQPQYPSTSYPSSYRSPTPPVIGPVDSSQPSYPTTNSASGYRHERTGSGFH